MNCSAKFQHRSQAIYHYRKLHSIAILCQICEKPISAKDLYNLVTHFKKVHPDKDIPENIKQKLGKKIADVKGTAENALDESNSEVR